MFLVATLVHILSLFQIACCVLGPSSRPVVHENQQRSLHEYLFSNYQPQIRPVMNNEQATHITVQMYIKQILKVSERDQILTVYFWMEQYWRDELLTWDPSEYANISLLHVPADAIWKPDLVVYNKIKFMFVTSSSILRFTNECSAKMNTEGYEMSTNAIVHYDGNVSLFKAMITDVTCPLLMTHFPFDQQFCHLMLASWTLDGSLLQLHFEGEHLSLSHYVDNLEWTLTAFKIRRNLRWYNCCTSPYPDISYYLVIRRNPVYYLLLLIVPSAFITVVAVVGFFTPRSSNGENTEKVSLGVTALLSLAIMLMMVSDKLPATANELPLLGQYYVGLILIMFVATCSTTATFSIQMRGNGGRVLSASLRHVLNRPWATFLSTGRLPKCYCTKQKKKSYVYKPITDRDLDAEVVKPSVNGYEQSLGYPVCYQNGQTNYTLSRIHKAPSGQLAKQLLEQPVRHVLHCVRSIDTRLKQQQIVNETRSEWQLLARLIERVLMVMFIMCTIILAVYMLYDTQMDLIITHSLMDTL